MCARSSHYRIACSTEVVDAGLIDGIGVNGTARGIRAIAANGLKYAQTGLTQSYIFFMIVGAVAIVGYLLR